MSLSEPFSEPPSATSWMPISAASARTVSRRAPRRASSVSGSGTGSRRSFSAFRAASPSTFGATSIPSIARFSSAFFARRAFLAASAAASAASARRIAPASTAAAQRASRRVKARAAFAAARRAGAGADASSRASSESSVSATSRATTPPSVSVAAAAASPPWAWAPGEAPSRRGANDRKCAACSARRTSPPARFPFPDSSGAAAAATAAGGTATPSAEATSEAYAEASAAEGALKRTRASGKPSAPTPATVSAPLPANPGIDVALEVSAMGRLVVRISAASAAMNPRSSPRSTSTSSNRIKVFCVCGLACVSCSSSGAARFLFVFVSSPLALSASFFGARAPKKPAALGFAFRGFAVSPPRLPPAPCASPRLCVASENCARISAPLRLRDAFTSRTVKPISRAAAYAQAVLHAPDGPQSNAPVAGTPRASTSGTYRFKPSRDSSSKSFSKSFSKSSSEDSVRGSFLGFFFGRPGPRFCPPLSASARSRSGPVASAAMCARHAPSQSRTCAAAATSPTTSLAAAGLYASTHNRLAPSLEAGPLARISPSRRRSSPRVAASAPETIAAAFQRPSPASTNFAASVSIASSSSSLKELGFVAAPFVASSRSLFGGTREVSSVRRLSARLSGAGESATR